MKSKELEIVEKKLEGKISKNPNRFESANGIIFKLNQDNSLEINEYFNSMGIEYYDWDDGMYYTETIMTGVEFSKLKYVSEYLQIA